MHLTLSCSKLQPRNQINVNFDKAPKIASEDVISLLVRLTGAKLMSVFICQCELCVQQHMLYTELLVFNSGQVEIHMTSLPLEIFTKSSLSS